MGCDKPELDSEYDYILYFGAITFQGYNSLSNLLEIMDSGGKSKGCFIPITNGGDADAAYRMARALGHHYPHDLKVMVLDACKSAGTLIAIGAKELIIANRGELGPLDVQLQKKEELLEMSSGLDIVQSLLALQEHSLLAFRQYLIDLSIGANLGTKFAAKLATELTSSIVSPIASQIDPLRIGEHQRALRVATAYGTRLNEKFANTSEKQINTLLIGYPSHSFVIDRKEASKLFKNVRELNDQEQELGAFLRKNTMNFAGLAAQVEPTVISVDDVINNVAELEREREDTTNEKSVKKSAKTGCPPSNGSVPEDSERP